MLSLRFWQRPRQPQTTTTTPAAITTTAATAAATTATAAKHQTATTTAVWQPEAISIISSTTTCTTTTPISTTTSTIICTSIIRTAFKVAKVVHRRRGPTFPPPRTPAMFHMRSSSNFSPPDRRIPTQTEPTAVHHSTMERPTKWHSATVVRWLRQRVVRLPATRSIYMVCISDWEWEL